MNKTLKNLMLLTGGIGIGAFGMLRVVGFCFGWKVEHPKRDRDAIYQLEGLDKTLIVIDAKREMPKGVHVAFLVDDK